MATDDAARDAPPPRALWYAGPRIARIAPAARHLPPARAEDPLAEAPGAPWVSVRTLFSALSRGTERLVFNDRVPASERDRMRAPFQEGAFPHPVKYGYANVGEVVAASADAAAQALIGRRVFSLFPHQDRFAAPLDAVTPLPERGGPPPDRATLAANMETALTALWDGAAAPGDRIAVVGAGVLGGLIAGLA
ncbi:MAG: dehydrogenase, partial [Pseudomonadota bacterium]